MPYRPDWDKRPVTPHLDAERKHDVAAMNPWQLFVTVAELHGRTSPQARQAYAELRAYTKREGIRVGFDRRRHAPRKAAA